VARPPLTQGPSPWAEAAARDAGTSAPGLFVGMAVTDHAMVAGLKETVAAEGESASPDLGKQRHEPAQRRRPVRGGERERARAGASHHRSRCRDEA
jgi:hypothetical protein